MALSQTLVFLFLSPPEQRRKEGDRLACFLSVWIRSCLKQDACLFWAFMFSDLAALG